MLEFAVLPLGNVGEAGSRGLHQYLLNAQSCLVKHFLQHKKLISKCGTAAHQIGKSTKNLQCSELPHQTFSAGQKV